MKTDKITNIYELSCIKCNLDHVLLHISYAICFIFYRRYTMHSEVITNEMGQCVGFEASKRMSNM